MKNKWLFVLITLIAVGFSFYAHAQEQTVTFSAQAFNVEGIQVTDLTDGKNIELKNSYITQYKGSVITGHQIRIEATPKKGYQFRNAYIEQNGEKTTITSFPYEFVAGDKEVKVNVRCATVLTYSVKSGEGTLAAEQSVIDYDYDRETIYPINNGSEFMSEDVSKITFTATPKEGYITRSWYVNGEIQDGKSDNIFSIEDPTSSLDVQVVFDEIVVEKSVQVEIRAFGTKTYSLFDETAEQEVKLIAGIFPKASVIVGHKLSIRAEGIDGTELIGAYIKESGEAEQTISTFPYEYIVTEKDFVLQLSFAYVAQFGVKRDNEGSTEGGTIRASRKIEEEYEPLQSGASFMDPQEIRFTATPNQGYQIKAWYLNDQLQEGKDADFVIANPQQSLKVEVEFVRLYPVTASVSNVDYGSIRIENLSVSPAVQVANEEVVESGTVLNFILTLNDQCQVKNWMINGEKVESDKTEMTVSLNKNTSRDGKLTIYAELFSTVSISEISPLVKIFPTERGICLLAPIGSSFQIYDLSGIPILQGKTDSIQIEVACPQGAYIVNVAQRTEKVFVY